MYFQGSCPDNSWGCRAGAHSELAASAAPCAASTNTPGGIDRKNILLAALNCCSYTPPTSALISYR